MRRTRLCYVKLLKILAALVRQRNTCGLCQRWTVSWWQLATSFEDVMVTYHPPRIAEEVDCTFTEYCAGGTLERLVSEVPSTHTFF